MAKVNCSLTINLDATDPAARDTTVNISSHVLDLLKTKFTDLEVIEQDDDRLLVTGNLDIEDPSAFHIDD